MGIAISIVKELAVIAGGCLLVLGGCALGLRAYPAASADYAQRGAYFVTGFSLVFGVACVRCAHSGVRQAVASSLAVFSVSMAFFVVIPVTIERSVSVFLLQTMGAPPVQAYAGADLQSVLMSDFLCKRAGIEKRMAEQQSVGNIAQLPDERFQLTARGQAVVRTLTAVGAFFSVSPHNAAPSATTQCMSFTR